MSKKTRRNEKKIYQKPEVKIIDLAADEVMATGCKTSNTASAPGGFLNDCITAGCHSIYGS